MPELLAVVLVSVVGFPFPCVLIRYCSTNCKAEKKKNPNKPKPQKALIYKVQKWIKCFHFLGWRKWFCLRRTKTTQVAFNNCSFTTALAPAWLCLFTVQQRFCSPTLPLPLWPMSVGISFNALLLPGLASPHAASAHMHVMWCQHQGVHWRYGDWW